jgi:NAD(P)H-dependent flavin oxidoreductase YrpB (nitropropane dioxygenase family)
VDLLDRLRLDVPVAQVGMAFGLDRPMISQLTDHGVFVFVMVGTPLQARRAIDAGADGLIAQGAEAGGHLTGDSSAMMFLPQALDIADGRPVLLAGGIATAADTRAGEQ